MRHNAGMGVISIRERSEEPNNCPDTLYSQERIDRPTHIGTTLDFTPARDK